MGRTVYLSRFHGMNVFTINLADESSVNPRQNPDTAASGSPPPAQLEPPEP